jgi:hypothetical protein
MSRRSSRFRISGEIQEIMLKMVGLDKRKEAFVFPIINPEVKDRSRFTRTLFSEFD